MLVRINERKRRPAKSFLSILTIYFNKNMEIA